MIDPLEQDKRELERDLKRLREASLEMQLKPYQERLDEVMSHLPKPLVWGIRKWAKWRAGSK